MRTICTGEFCYVNIVVAGILDCESLSIHVCGETELNRAVKVAGQSHVVLGIGSNLGDALAQARGVPEVLEPLAIPLVVQLRDEDVAFLLSNLTSGATHT